MRDLDEKEIYYTGDLNKQQFETLLDWLKKNDIDWEDTNIEDIQILNGYDSLKYSNESWWWAGNSLKTKNAKELFYTLENIQVDCSELSEEQIKEMADVFNTNGFETWYNINALKKDTHLFLEIGIGNEVYLNYKKENKTTITYEKFIELFGNKEKERIMQELNRWYKYDDGSLFYVISECKEGHLYGYGLDKDSWVYYGEDDEYRCVFNNGAKNYKTPATKEEVEERLKQEAIKRGFVKGVEVGCLNSVGYFSEIEIDCYYLDERCDEVLWNSFCVDSNVIMKDGVWLEIENDKALVEDVIETTDEVSPINLSSIFSSREEKLKKTLKYLLKRDIILTPKQYKKLWEKS